MKLIRPMWSLAPLLALAPAVLALGSSDANAPQDKTGNTTNEKSKKDTPKPAETPTDTVAIGSPAPNFTLKDVDGKEVKLADYKGKIVVLEWFNPSCPFVVAAHEKDGALRDMAGKVARDGVIWLSINSGAPGKEGAGAELNKKMAAEWKIQNPVLIDESGDVGRMYGAKTTPHMFIIDAKGALAYRGALDNSPRGKLEGDKKMNYVEDALAELKAGKPVTTKETRAYGCSVKYGAKP